MASNMSLRAITFYMVSSLLYALNFLHAVPAPGVACPITINAVTAQDEGCPGAGDGAVTIEADCETCAADLEYSLDGDVFQAEGAFSGLAAGDYTITVREVGGTGCAETVGITVEAGVDSEAPVPNDPFTIDWGQVAKISPDNPSTNDQFGGSVAVSGNLAVVGVAQDDTGATDVGAAYVYEYIGSSWVRVAKLQAADKQAGDQFGTSVSISGNSLLVGARYDDGGGTDAGSAYVFERTKGGGWVQVAKLQAADRQGNDQFGYRVAISGERLIVGALFESTGAVSAGSAYVFERTEGGGWAQVAKLQAADKQAYDLFGGSVSISGDLLVVGASEQDTGGTDAGAAYVFERTAGSSWSQVAKLQAADKQADDRFGSSVAIVGNQLVVGAVYEDAAGTDAGAAYVFERTQGNGWAQVAKLQSADNQAFGLFGNSVAISGEKVVVGAYLENTGGTYVGAAYVFQRTASDGWIQVSRLQAADGQPFDQFGASVAISDNSILVGALTTDTGGANAGAAYFFDIFYELPSDTLPLCGDPVIAVTPTATDDCAGQIIGTTTDPTTFDTAGTYAIDWTFEDENGNLSIANQIIKVVQRNISIASVDSTNPTCPGSNDGTLTVMASCTNCPGSLAYSIDGINYQPSNVFTALPAGEYQVFVSADGCSASSSVAILPATDETAPAVVGEPTTPFTETQKVVSGDVGANDYFGEAIAVDGGYAIVGARGESSSGERSGAAYIIKRSGTGWAVEQKLIAADSEAGDGFGASVAISGEYAMVGAPEEDTEASDAGAVYVYRRNGATGAWEQQRKLTIPGSVDNTNFGAGIAMHNQYAVIGARRIAGSSNGVTSGGYIYHLQNDAWMQEATVTPSDASTGLGAELAIHNDRVLLGRYTDNTSGTLSGSAYVFHRNGTTWTEMAKLTASDSEAFDYFAWDVALHGDYAVIGSPSERAGETGVGAAYVFHYTESDGWKQTAKLRAGDQREEMYFGWSVAVTDGRLVVGARFEDTGGFAAGAAYLFDYQENSWTQSQKIQASDKQESELFGTSVAITEDHALVGAYADETNRPLMGSLYFFSPTVTLPTDTLAYCGSSTTAIPPTATDNCAGQVKGTTTDPTTFDAPGTYTIQWTFDDGNGNVTVAGQTVVVEAPIFPLPIVETVETDSPTRDCWTSNNNRWNVTSSLAAYTGTGLFTLSPSPVAEGIQEILYSPTFSAQTEEDYILSFFSRHDNDTYASTPLRVMLVNAEDNSVIKQVFHDRAVNYFFVPVYLRFIVPTNGNYRVAFESLSKTRDNGLMLDDITIAAFTPPADGAAALTGLADGACTTLYSYGLDGEAFTRFVDPVGKLALEINSNGNDLGDVVVEMTDYTGPPTAPFLNEALLSRYFNITPENGSGPYTANGGVRLRLYFLDEELDAFGALRERTIGWESLVVTHYDAENTDCRLENSTDERFDLLLPSRATEFGLGAHYLEVLAQEFSEFGATSSQAAPVTLTSFTAEEAGPLNELEWHVDTEVDFSHYSVQRSTDGIRFSELSRVDGAGSSHYSLTDPAPADLTYYQLQMVDTDGTYAYSPVVSVSRKHDAATTLQAYPVPSTNRVTLRFNVRWGGKHQLTLVDALGRTVGAQTFEAQAGVHERPVELSSLPTGTYQLLLKTPERTHSVRIIKN